MEKNKDKIGIGKIIEEFFDIFEENVENYSEKLNENDKQLKSYLKNIKLKNSEYESIKIEIEKVKFILFLKSIKNFLKV